MEADSNKVDTAIPSTSDVLSVICFILTAYCILKLFQPLQDAPMAEPSPGPPRAREEEIIGTSDISNEEQLENVETERESPEEEILGTRRNEWEESFGVEGGRTNIISLSESEGSGAGGLSGEEEDEDEGEREDKDNDWDGDEDEDEDEENDQEEKEDDEEKAKPRSSKERGRTWAAYNAPTNPRPSKNQREIKPPRKLTDAQRKYDTDFYRPYNLEYPNPGAPVLGPHRHYDQYNDHALYINPNLKVTELDQIPHFGVRVDDLTASKVLPHFSQKTLNERWQAEFDVKGMIRATRAPLGRAAKCWVESGQRDVEEKRVEEEGWYYLSWGGIHTLMGKEGLDADRYWVRPSFESFKCPGLGFKKSDWAEIQLAPEDPEDPTIL